MYDAYFDSNLYSTMIRWLPLRDGNIADIPVYDYNPAGKTGVSKVSITEVKSASYETAISGKRNMWIVTVSAAMGSAGNSVSTYFIDKSDRNLWQQEINAGARKMCMQFVEH